MGTLAVYLGLGIAFAFVCIIADTIKSARERYEIAWRWLPVSFAMLTLFWPVVAMVVVVVAVVNRKLKNG